jgi:endonuclease-3
MLEAGIEKLKQYIKIIGLYNSKAANIMKLSEILVAKYNSQVPDKFEDLITLPGVGAKTANVMLNCAFDQPTIAVDTHVFRVAHRLGLSAARKHEQVGIELTKIVPKKFLKCAHHLMILHGRYTCKARKPDCENCCIKEYCDYKLKL